MWSDKFNASRIRRSLCEKSSGPDEAGGLFDLCNDTQYEWIVCQLLGTDIQGIQERVAECNVVWGKEAKLAPGHISYG